MKNNINTIVNKEEMPQQSQSRTLIIQKIKNKNNKKISNLKNSFYQNKTPGNFDFSIHNDNVHPKYVKNNQKTIGVTETNIPNEINQNHLITDNSNPHPRIIIQKIKHKSRKNKNGIPCSKSPKLILDNLYLRNNKTNNHLQKRADSLKENINYQNLDENSRFFLSRHQSSNEAKINTTMINILN